MFRARPVGILLVSIGIVLMSFGVSTPVAPRDPPPTVGALEPAAVVGWPPSTALLLAEVVTGGGSASDEFVEIVNVGAVPLDLNGIELAYASAAGTSAARKILWSISRVLDPGRRLLAANVSGIFASVADATWSGGIAATGGTVVLRSVGGTVIDAAGWGDATNAWVEGSAAVAPPAGSSIERRPGGDLGNAADSNDNAADWFVQAAPIAQGLNTPPQPTPTPTPTLAPTTSPTPNPTATATQTVAPTAAPTATSTPPPTVEPTTAPTSDPTLAPSPTPEPTPEPTIEPTPEPTPTFEQTPEPTVEPTPEPTFEPTSEPTASPTPDATPEPTPESTPEPTVMPTPAPTPDPTNEPTNEPSPTPEATASPSLEPSPTPFASPTPSVTPSPTPEPTPSPSPSPSPVVTIAAARVLADGVTVTVEAVLTTPIGALESGRGAFVQDETAGIALYLDGATSLAYPPGVVVRATGLLGTRFGQRVIRLAQADIAAIASDELPTPVSLTTGEIGEDEEGRRIATEGHVGAAPDSVTDGVAIDLDDGSGSIRVVIATSAIPSGLAKGALVQVTGPVGQRDSGSGGGYRIHVTTPGEIEVVAPPPTPTPKPTATPKPSATPGPSATLKATAAPKPSEAPKPTATAKPSATPKPTSSPKPTATPVAAISIASARGAEAGTVVRVAGVVTIAPGGLGSLDLVAIQDDTAGIVVKLHTPEYLVPGTRIEVTGPLGQPYGQLEVRPDQDGWRTLGTAPMPLPLVLSAYPGEGEEGRIVTLEVVVEGSVSRGENGDFSVPVAFDGSSLSVRADGTSGISPAEFRRGATLRLTGVIGQRASATGRADGYRLWLRLPADVEVRSPGPSASVRPGSSPGATRRPGSTAKPKPPSVKTIGRAVTSSGDVTVEGTVTTPPALLDGDGRTIVIQDRSGAVAVRVPAGTSVSVNDRVRVVGEVGRAYGAPRIVADEVTGLGRGTSPAPIIVKDVPTAALEWRLASVTGTVDRVTRDGDRWRAEIAVGSKRIPVDGLASSGIPASTIVKGGRITLTGIVRRPHPSAADRRFAIAPRSAADVHVTATASTGGAAASPRTSTGQGSGTARASGAASPTRLLAPGTTLEITESALAVVDVEFASLATAVGRNVRVGGLVVEVRLDAVVVDDGSAQGLILVAPDAASVLGVLQPGDALNAVGTVVADPELAVHVLDPAGLVPVSAVAPIEDGSADAGPDAAASDATTSIGTGEDVGLTKVAPDPKPAPRPMEVALFGLGLASAGAVLLAVVRRRRPAEAAAGGPAEQA